MGFIGERSWLNTAAQVVDQASKRLLSNSDRSFAALSECAAERWSWTALSVIAFLLCAPPALRSPDGLEMLRLSAQWMGADATVADPGFWPKLWPALNLPACCAKNALPLGLQCIAGWQRDDELLWWGQAMAEVFN